MRSLGAALLATSLIVSTAFAATTTTNSQAPLAPGKPAGVKQAQGGISTTALIVIVGIGGAIAAIAFGTASSGNPGQQVTLTTVPSTTS